LAFEKLEAVRWLGRLKNNGRMFINLQEIAPMPVITGAEAYPADIEQRIRAAVPDAVFVDALGIAAEAGNAKAVNTVLLGVMAHHMGLDKQAFLDAIEDTVPPKFRELNLTAFEKGYTA
jgi:indolepyruvate ferredoxin oxidoreductase beta subunit